MSQKAMVAQVARISKPPQSRKAGKTIRPPKVRPLQSSS
jgi:hypothetical protein